MQIEKVNNNITISFKYDEVNISVDEAWELLGDLRRCLRMAQPRTKERIKRMMEDQRNTFYMICGAIVSKSIYDSYIPKDTSYPDGEIGNLRKDCPLPPIVSC